MDKNQSKPGKSEAHDRHHAKKRRARRDYGKLTEPATNSPVPGENKKLYLYGLHTVRQALANPSRKKTRLFATKNALQRLELDPSANAGYEVAETSPKQLDRMLPADAVHQGVVLEADPLLPSTIDELGNCNLMVVLDQLTDPHNVGAIMRSAVAMDAKAIVTTVRHSPGETAVLAKSASGALDLIQHVSVTNLAQALETLNRLGFATIGLDSDAQGEFTALPKLDMIALVLGAEGKGLRQKTRESCQHLVRLDMPGPIKSLNVSNAAAITLYECRRLLGK